MRASRNGTVTLDWPNRDVAVSMARLYSRILLGGKPCVETGKDSLTDVLASGTLEDITARLNALMSAVDYQAYPVRTEAECLSCLQTLMIGAEMVPGVTAHEEAGRSALEVDAGNRRWVFEIKAARDGREALRLLDQEVRALEQKRPEEPSGKEPLMRAALVFDLSNLSFLAAA